MEDFTSPGVSIIVPSQKSAENVERLLKAFTINNSYYPFEVVIIDDGSGGSLKNVVKKWSKKIFIHYLKPQGLSSLSSLLNYAAQRAYYPLLLFLNSDIIYSKDALIAAVKKLQDEKIGAVAVGLDYYPAAITEDRLNYFKYMGIEMVKDKAKKLYSPKQVIFSAAEWENKTIPGREYAAVNGFFLLCRKSDFQALSGFSEEYESGLVYIDFCFKLKHQLAKGVFCTNKSSLQVTEPLDQLFSFDDRQYLNELKLFNAKFYREDLPGYAWPGEPITEPVCSTTDGKQLSKKSGKEQTDYAQTEEDLLRRQQWDLLVKENEKRVFSPPDLGGLKSVGWVQPHLNTCGGIRRAIEMSNRLADWGSDFYLITPQGIKTDWLPIRARVISFEEALKKEFSVLIVSDPVCIDMFMQLKKKGGLFYHLHAYMLYREKNEALALYYKLSKEYPNVSNSRWTAEQVERYCGVKSFAILPGGISKTQFKPCPVEKAYDTCYFGAEKRRFKATREIKEVLNGLSQLSLESCNAGQDQLASLISASRVFVSGSYYEGFNFCPLEAMACGVPVVMTDCGGSQEYAVNDFNALVVASGDYPALRAQAERLLEDSRLRKRLIENGLKTVWNYDWDRITAHLGNLLTEVHETGTLGQKHLKRGPVSDLPKAARQVKALRAKLLEQGFTAKAYDDLEQLAADQSNLSLQKAAAWELALWHADRGTADDAQKSLSLLARAREDETGQAVLNRIAIVEAECCELLGDLSKGKVVINECLAKDPGTDLFLAAANLERDVSKKIRFINQALECSVVSKLVFLDSIAANSYDIFNGSSAAINRTESLKSSLPKVTVIVPVYNAEKTLHTALDSLIAQTWWNIEILVVDDHSTDHTVELVRQYENKDRRIRLITLNANQGPYVARNEALRVASGDFITCHDADDWSHPEKIEIQAQNLLQNSNLVANISRWARVTNNLHFYRRGNPGFYVQLNISSLMIRRKTLIDQLGCWDSVRFGADTELYRRIKRVFGEQALYEFPTEILSFARCSKESLTENEIFGYPGYIMGARKEYRESYLHYYETNKSLKYSYPLLERPFPVPAIMQPDREAVPAGRRFFDLIVVSDFRQPATIELAMPKIVEAKNAGRRIGIVQMARYDLNLAGKIAAMMRDNIDGDRIQVLVYGDRVSCDNLLIMQAAVLQEKQRFIPDIEAKAISVVIDQPPTDGNNPDRPYYDFASCAKHLAEYFDQDATWYPLSSELRASLDKYDSKQLKAINLAADDWVERGDQAHEQSPAVYTPAQSAHRYAAKQGLTAGLQVPAAYGEAEEDDSIILVDLKAIEQLTYEDSSGMAVIMPCTNSERGLEAARLLVKRSGCNATVLVVIDTLQKGYVYALNEALPRLDVGFVTYLAETAYPCIDWLKMAHDTLLDSGKNLLAFNCGKWKGQFARFGLVRAAWFKKLYGGPLFFPEYKDFGAEKELTLLALLSDGLVYNPECMLIEIEDGSAAIQGEGLLNSADQADRELFERRFKKQFDLKIEKGKTQFFEQYRHFLDFDQSGPKIKGREGSAIELVDVKDLAALVYDNPEGVAVVMPCIDVEKGLKTAKLLVKRAGIEVKVIVVKDTIRQGFIKTLNETANRINVKYLVYLAEDAYPGVNWLQLAYNNLEATGKGLLAFNCGKWRGRIAAFGMIRTKWVKSLYGGPLLFPEYRGHKADNELTLIARVTEQLVYDPEVVLVENDANKVFKESIPEDKLLFHQRFYSGFDNLVSKEAIEPFAKAYFVPEKKQNDSKASNKSLPDKSLFYHAPPGDQDIEVFKEQYAKSDLAREKDNFVLYRIIGNDLIPRHRKGQSRDNLRFILEKEKPFADCEKRFIVNRIIDPEEERAVIELLNDYGAKYLHLPFEADLYRNIGFDLEALRGSKILIGPEIDDFAKDKRFRLYLALYRLKNNYVMNNNGARNLALGDGSLRAKWVLPFDGNCFITPQAWEQIYSGVTGAPYYKYFVVPMTRMQSNDALFAEGFTPEPQEEPQLIFRKDAAESFDEELPYGRRPKVELFWRLQIAGKWDKFIDDPWDKGRPKPAPEAGQFGIAGWVARLSSGKNLLDRQDKTGVDQRWFARASAILTTLQSLDVSLAGSGKEMLSSVRKNVLAVEVATQTDPAISGLLSVLKDHAEEALGRGPYAVIDKSTLPPSGNRQDYWHPAPYWWPDPEKVDGLPYIRKDGERVPGTLLYEPESDKYDRTRLQRVFDDSFTLALAWQFFGDTRYAEHGANILERFFVNPSTRMNPHLKYGQVRLGHDGNMGASSGIIEMKDFYFYLDAVRILMQAGVIREEVITGFYDWLTAYLDWLLNSPQGKTERGADNNHGTCYDLQVAAIASFVDRQEIVYETLIRALTRISGQFAPDGSQPREQKRKTTAHYCCFNMQCWVNLAEVASRWGVDLWNYKTTEGIGLLGGINWLVSHLGKPWPYEQIDYFDAERFLPVWFAGLEQLKDLPAAGEVPKSPYAVKPIFFPHDGIRPFWNLGSTGVEEGIIKSK